MLGGTGTGTGTGTGSGLRDCRYQAGGISTASTT